jgi:hypothetical protein
VGVEGVISALSGHKVSIVVYIHIKMVTGYLL